MVFFNIILVLALLSAMIIVHEFGHWVVARKLGFQTPVFGFGLPFGSCIKLGKWKDTEFRFHWFVLGGYVAIPELGDESNDDLLKEIPDLKPFKVFPIWKRVLVASAGVFFNILFAYLMCLIMVATIGPPSSKEAVMITNLLDSKKAVQGQTITPNPIAKDAGLRAGDIILKINHIKMKNPTQVVQMVRANPGKELLFKIKRKIVVDSKQQTQIVRIKIIPNKEGKIGVGLGMARSGEYDKASKNPLEWFIQAGMILTEWTVTMLVGLWLMISNIFGVSPAGAPKITSDDLHGIIAIVSIFAQAITVDFKEVFRWTALINVNLAIVNLLPIPALDGGHLLFMLIEKIRGKKLAESIQQKAIQTGFLLLILLMFFVLFNDIKGLIAGKFNIMKEEESSVKKD